MRLDLGRSMRAGNAGTRHRHIVLGGAMPVVIHRDARRRIVFEHAAPEPNTYYSLIPLTCRSTATSMKTGDILYGYED
jgi:hypothetical protein